MIFKYHKNIQNEDLASLLNFFGCLDAVLSFPLEGEQKKTIGLMIRKIK